MPKKSSSTTGQKRTIRGKLFRLAWKSTAALLILLAAVYAYTAAVYMTSGKVMIKRDFVAEFNAPSLAIPESDRAWPLYREAFVGLGGVPNFISASWRPEDPSWDTSAEYLDAHANEIELLLQAASKPGSGIVLSTGIDPEDHAIWPEAGATAQSGRTMTSFPMLDLRTTTFGLFRQAGQLLAFRAIHAANQGESETAAESIIAMLSIATHVGQAQTTISQLIQMSIEAYACQTVEYTLLLSEPPMDDRWMAAIQEAFRTQHGGGPVRIDFIEERFRMLDFEQRVYTDDGSGNGVLTVSGVVSLGGAQAQNSQPSTAAALIGIPFSAAMPRRKTFRIRCDDLFRIIEERAALPLWERDGNPIEDFVEGTQSGIVSSMRWSFFWILAPLAERPLVNAEKLTMQLEATGVILAMHRFHAAHGAWPTSLDELVPEFLDALPIDRFDGQPLRYLDRSPEKPLLYSVGANRVDDGGLVGVDQDGFPSNQFASRWVQPSLVRAILEGTYEDDRDELDRRRNPIENLLPPEADYILWPPLPEKPIEPPAGILDP